MRIVTWNMQGSNHSFENKWNLCVQNLMSNRGAEVCCLQECGALPNSAKLQQDNYCGYQGLAYYTWGTQRQLKHILFYGWDANGNRCNLAIVSKYAPFAGGIIYPQVNPVWRPALGFQLDDHSYVLCIHAISPGGHDVNGLLNTINNTIGTNDWAAFGDYNREPGTLVTGFTICPPNNNTYSVNNPRKMYDYCVRKNGMGSMGHVQNMVYSDHFPVLYDIS